jgi:hypothetical protein
MIVTVVTGLALIYRMVVLLMPKLRVAIISWKASQLFNKPTNQGDRIGRFFDY